MLLKCITARCALDRSVAVKPVTFLFFIIVQWRIWCYQDFTPSANFIRYFHHFWFKMCFISTIRRHELWPRSRSSDNGTFIEHTPGCYCQDTVSSLFDFVETHVNTYLLHLNAVSFFCTLMTLIKGIRSVFPPGGVFQKSLKALNPR